MSLSAQIREDARRRRRRGFTLVELLAVMATMTILAGIVVGVVALATRKIAEANTRTEMEQIKALLEEYRLEYGEYPRPIKTDEDREMTLSSFGVLTNYLDEIGANPEDVDFIDEWGSNFRYGRKADAKLQYRLRSPGRDATVDTGDDITNWRGE